MDPGNASAAPGKGAAAQDTITDNQASTRAERRRALREQRKIAKRVRSTVRERSAGRGWLASGKRGRPPGSMKHRTEPDRLLGVGVAGAHYSIKCRPVREGGGR